MFVGCSSGLIIRWLSAEDIHRRNARLRGFFSPSERCQGDRRVCLTGHPVAPYDDITRLFFRTLPE